MSRPATVTPYKDKTELLKIRHLFFHDQENHTSLKNAVDTVAYWQTRGKLPHAVNATAWIVSAMLRDAKFTQTNENGDPGSLTLNFNLDGISNPEEFVLRNAYSMALVRFVNGILDPFQQGSFAIALLALAKDIGLPYSFVEIRHWATHEQLPSLEILRSTSREALSWLNEKYWLQLDLVSEVKRPMHKSTHKPCPRLDVISSLRAYRSFVKKENTTKKTQQKANKDYPEIQKLISISQDGCQSYHLVRLLSLKKALLKDVPFPTAQIAYGSLLESLPPSFLLRLVFAILLESESSTSNDPTVLLKNEEHDIVVNWFGCLIPQILQGPFPFELHQHQYSCKQDVILGLENYICLLDQKNDYLNVIRLFGRAVPEKRKFTKVPLLDEILSEPRTPFQKEISKENEPNEFSIPKRKKINSLVFEDITMWDPLPFGVHKINRR